METQKPTVEIQSAVIRFAGDSGDGMQLTGTQFTNTTAVFGNDISTLPDFPAEIRAPAGSLPGVSGFQINFGSQEIRTPGDRPDVLVAMNPAALKVNLADLVEGGTVIVNEDSFQASNLDKAGYESNPLDDGSLEGYRVIRIPLTTLTLNAIKDTGLDRKQGQRCKNFFALGVVYWMYDRPLDHTLNWIQSKFGRNPAVLEANTAALKHGFNYAETTEIFTTHYSIRKASLAPGKYRNLTGNQAIALGAVTAMEKSGRELFYGSYPITPASEILQELSRYKKFGVKTFQAEDEIAAIGAALGASFAGGIGLTGTSGPGVALKGEFIGLAVMTELPLVIVNIQRGGPSTGLPTKTEQSDLFQAIYGRNGECPVPVIAACSPGDCFWSVLEAFRIAMKYMTPVMLLSDGYLANGSEPWRIPSLEDLPDLSFPNATDQDTFQPYARDEKTLSRPWAIPGTPGLEHRIGGLEKQHLTGNVSYDPQNHDNMVRLRAKKVAGIAQDIPPTEIYGDPEGDALIVGWGGTRGAITSATEQLRAKGLAVSSIHIRHINPLPPDLTDIFSRFKKVFVAEINLGQLWTYLRATLLLDSISINQVRGKPFMIQEIMKKVEEQL
ncbi:MAG: 2-oxoacid:acceptor oxidoreductase subunit alpha [Candidatus Omnitrophica bacterium]|nr:2-oxoacid:acceptor oxidoreductase subunit alpha [Candidatus Omnitrophota bacterium]